MATNLRAKIKSSDTIVIHDVNTETTAKFAQENKGIEVAECVREVAEKSVRIQAFCYTGISAPAFL